MSARAVWSGAVTFGLVSVPCKLYTATTEQAVRFNQINRDTGARVRQKRVDDNNPSIEVPYENIVKGYELRKGQYVVITEEELNSVSPEKTKAVVVEQFVPLAEIDPMSFGTSYWVGPADDVSKNAYALLSRAIDSTRAVGIGRLILRSKESLVALRAVRGYLAVTLLKWADEINPPEKVLGSLDGAINERELGMAKTLVSQLTSEWRPEEFKDEHRERVIAMIEAKAKGMEVPAGTEEEAPAAAPDLMAALEASLMAVQSSAQATA